MATSNISSILNSKLRMTGLTTGLDVDGIIKSILAADTAKVEKAKQNKELQLWKQDSYREVTNLLRTFKSDNFDVLKPTSNFTSASSLAVFNTSYSTGSADMVSVTGTADTVTANHSIEVTQLATQATINTGTITKAVAASNSLTAFPMDLTGKNISVTLDGTVKTISLANYNNLSDLSTGIQNSLDSAFGTGRVTLSLTGGSSDKLAFNTSTGSSLSIAASDEVFTSLGFASTDSKTNRISLSSSLASLANGFKTGLTIADPTANVSFTINNTVIDLGKDYNTATMSDLILAVNKSTAGVTMKYSDLTDTISLTNKNFGASNDLTLTDNSNNLLQSLGLIGGGSVKTDSKDSIINIDGVNGVKRSTNSFAIDGINYSLKKVGSVDFNIDKDTTELITRIKDFVTKFNDVIDKVTKLYSEKYDRTYLPLTDDEKSAMSETDITKWETKAKTGLLSNDTLLNSITLSLRRAVSEKVTSSGLTLSSIGIKSTSYRDNGKLTIDETKLKTALDNNYSDVVKLFTNESSVSYSNAYSSSTQKTARFAESGIGQRIADVLQDNIRTTNGKGALLIKAGLPGDTTEYINLITNNITTKTTEINNLIDKVNTKSDNLYKKYAALETAMNRMNSQSAWLTQQTSSGG